MALLGQMTQAYLLNLLLTNPDVQVFTGLNFSDYPNPTRVQVKNAWQALVDQGKYLAGVVIPTVYPDPSQASLPGGGAPTNPASDFVTTIGLNTGPLMNAYLENVYLPNEVE
jgi:hypothetical protein